MRTLVVTIVLVAALSCSYATAGSSSIVDSVLRARHGRLRREDVLRHAGLLAAPEVTVPDQYYSQTLDHFDRQNNARWQQRYWVCNDVRVLPG